MVTDHDLAILNRVLLYTSIPVEQRLETLKQASSDVQLLGTALVTDTQHDKFPVAHEVVKQWRMNRR